MSGWQYTVKMLCRKCRHVFYNKKYQPDLKRCPMCDSRSIGTSK
jgi:predicted Zn-ribbon and HTH transcriptional regulator